MFLLHFELLIKVFLIEIFYLIKESLDEFIVSQRGLYPLALGRHVKQTQLDKMKTKFKLIGKLLGRSLLDGRIVKFF